MNWNLPFNMFDVSLLVLLTLGVLRGRKHGMSEELMGLIKWLIIVAACSALYGPIGRWLADSSPISLLGCYIMVYVTIALLVLGIFALVKHSLGGKLIGSDIFGRAEYYLGMGSGLIRFSCMILAFLAILNARYYSSAEIKENKEFQKDVYGSEFFPGLQTAQSTVFERSLSGPIIRQHLSFLLIEPTKPERKAIHQKEYQLPH